MEEETLVAGAASHIDVNIAGSSLSGLHIWWENGQLLCSHGGAPEMVMIVEVDKMDNDSVEWCMQQADEEDPS